MDKSHGHQSLFGSFITSLAIAFICILGCGSSLDRGGESLLPEPCGWAAESSTVVIGSPGDRWLETIPYVRLERAIQDGEPGYQVTYRAPGLGAFALFWSRSQIDFTGAGSESVRSDMVIPGGRLYFPVVVSARSLPQVHRGILLLEKEYAKEANGAIDAMEGFLLVASMGSGPRVVRGPKPGPAVRPSVPAARAVASKYKPFTERNFRDNLIRFTGREPRGAHAHHILSRKYAKKFQGMGINIHHPRYGAWWSAKEHLSAAKKYNDAWKAFFDVPKQRTAEEALQFGRDLATSYGLPIHF